MNPIKLLFSGDFAPVGIAEEKPGKASTLNIDESIYLLFNKYDLRITNLECPLTESKNKIPKTGPHVKSHPMSISVLKKLKINVACLSNNHIRDYGDQGVIDTIETCNKAGIKTVGAGKNSKEASAPLYIGIKDKTIAFLNFSESEFNSADGKCAGSNPDDPIHIWRCIQIAKKVSDYQIIQMHGGKEMHPYPTPYQIKLFRFIADQGVNAVIGHHTHVIGGYEMYKNTPLVYSLGNFIFDDASKSEKWNKGVLIGLILNDEVSEMNFHLTHLDQNTIKIIDNQRHGNNAPIRFIDILNEVYALQEWDKLLKEQEFFTIRSLLNLNLIRRICFKIGLKKVSEKDKQFLLRTFNKFLCQTHRNMTLDTIKDYLHIK